MQIHTHVAKCHSNDRADIKPPISLGKKSQQSANRLSSLVSPIEEMKMLSKFLDPNRCVEGVSYECFMYFIYRQPDLYLFSSLLV